MTSSSNSQKIEIQKVENENPTDEEKLNEWQKAIKEGDLETFKFLSRSFTKEQMKV